MNGEYRRDWLLFAFIMWLSFGLAFRNVPLFILALLALGTANGWRLRRRRGIEQPGGDTDDEQVLRP